MAVGKPLAVCEAVREWLAMIGIKAWASELIPTLDMSTGWVMFQGGFFTIDKSGVVVVKLDLRGAVEPEEPGGLRRMQEVGKVDIADPLCFEKLLKLLSEGGFLKWLEKQGFVEVVG